MNDKIARFAVGSISPYFVSTSFKIQVQNIKAQASGVLELFLFIGKPEEALSYAEETSRLT